MRNLYPSLLLRLAAAMLVCTAAQTTVLAQGILHPRPEVREWPFSVKSVRVESAISDGVVETRVEQTFVNNSSVEQEGTYLFPLPESATVTSFSLRAGDRVIEGRLLSKEEARRIYESIVRRRQDPALLEYMGGGLFRAAVFPIPPRGERVLTLQYAQVLKPEGAVMKFLYPLSTGRFSSRPVGAMSVSVRLKTRAPLRTVYSPSHDVSVRRQDDHHATASWEGRGEYPDRDFVLYYATSADDVGLSLLTSESGDRDGYFLLVAAPRFSVPQEKILPKQVVFVLDRTGSMQPNNKMEQAKNALIYCLDNLHRVDRFNVITFNESADTFERRLVPASEENIKRARQFVREVEPSGGTNIDEALRTALSLLRGEEGTQKMIVFLTDGLPTVGETNVEKILENVRRANGGDRLASADWDDTKEGTGVRARIFCFGVGYDVNVPFLDRLAEQSKADADYVRPEESIESIVSAFYSKIASPILANLRLEFEGVETRDLYPKILPDLFKGGQLVVAGRYRGEGPGSVRLVGSLMGREQTFRLERAFGEGAPRSSLVPRIWAARKIGYLLDQVRLHRNQEVIDEIVRLSRDFGIITPYTSYLADERQDIALRPRALDRYSLEYEVDGSLALRVERELREELRALGGAERGVAGEVEAHRSLNSKGYQQANRAPTSVQGGFGGGGFGGIGDALKPRGGAVSAAPGVMGKMARKDVSVDFASATEAAKRIGLEGKEPGYKQVQVAARVQVAGNRVFYRRNNIWFDNAYKSGEKVLKIRALSEAHFQLLRAVPELSRYSAVGEEVVVTIGKNAVQIGKEGKEKLTEAELREMTLGLPRSRR